MEANPKPKYERQRIVCLKEMWVLFPREEGPDVGQAKTALFIPNTLLFYDSVNKPSKVNGLGIIPPPLYR
jgi:hypothetical protein